MSGFGAPSLTTTPIETVARLTRLLGTILPEAARPSTIAGVMIATSKASPDSIRFWRPPAVSLSTVTLLPVCFSKSGTSASTTCLKAPAVKTLTSAAEVGATADRQSATERQTARKICNFMDGTLLDLHLVDPRIDANERVLAGVEHGSSLFCCKPIEI